MVAHFAQGLPLRGMSTSHTPMATASSASPILRDLLQALRPLVLQLSFGYRLKRADPPLRLIYATLYRVANQIWFGLRVRDVDCAAKLFRRDVLRGISVHSDGAFFSAELLIRLRLAGITIHEVGVPHYPRVAGSPTGARLSVITRAIRDFWSLRIRLWLNRSRALSRGRSLLED